MRRGRRRPLPRGAETPNLPSPSTSTPKPPDPLPVNSQVADSTRLVSYTAALRPASPRAVKKNFEDVGDACKQATIYNNKPDIFYTKEEVAHMAEPYCFSLIGKFSGQRPSYAVVLQAFKNFRLSSLFNLRFLRSGYVFIHLTSNEDMARVWTGGIWFIAGMPLRIFKWSPYFSYAAESSIFPVWIQFPDMPIHMFNKHSLYSVARIGGKPIKLDDAMTDGTRLSMARVCVEIDLLKPKEECYAIGNRPKLMWNSEKRNLVSVGEDLRVVLNRKLATRKEKEVVTDRTGPSDEGVNIRVTEMPIWIQKKGASGGQAAIKKNSFNLLADLEEEVDDGLNSGNLEVRELEEGEFQGQPSTNVVPQMLKQKVLVPDLNVAALVSNFEHLALTRGLSTSIGKRPGRGNDPELSASTGTMPEESERNELSKTFVEEAGIEEDIATLVQRSSSLSGVSSNAPCTSGCTLNGPVKDSSSRLKAHLKWWNFDVFGNIHDKVKNTEENFSEAEKAFDMDPSEENKLHRAKSYPSFSNSKHGGDLLETKGTKFFEKLLTGEEYSCDVVNLDNILLVVDARDNLALGALSSIEEVRQTIWDMRKDSVAGPDGFLMEFYIACWEIIKEDVYGVILDFFKGSPFPKGMATTTIVAVVVLLPLLSVLHKVEMLFANFFWGALSSNKKTHWISWADLCKPKLEGGLGVRRLLDVATAIAMKLWFQFREHRASWTVYLARLYCVAVPPSVVLLKGNVSPCWHRLIKLRSCVERHIGWIIGSGRLNFWYDTWLDRGPLSLLCEVVGNPTCRVTDFMNNLKRDISGMQYVDVQNASVQGSGVQNFGVHIEGVHNFTVQATGGVEVLVGRVNSGALDSIIWKPSLDGKCYLKSAWNCARNVEQTAGIYLVVWSILLLPTMSVFVWRNDARHRGLKPAVPKIIWRIGQYISYGMVVGLIKQKHWKGRVSAARGFEINVRVQSLDTISLAYWKKPSVGGFKLNMDGCSKGSPGLSSYRVIVRDHGGNIVMAKNGTIGVGSNVRAELIAILKGLELCVENLLFSVWFEPDSLVALKMLRSSNVPWEFCNLLLKIRGIMGKYHILFWHVYREANATADYLVNQAYNFTVDRFMLNTDVDRLLFGICAGAIATSDCRCILENNCFYGGLLVLASVAFML
ncbi:hypothetical protein ZIOFF_051835 [Zingiber officinale]|uniref:RNase H type-1 domain-containing protein n=1 Tax=Zingiber officinale TaxID=94328 RepID=A0A8J5FL65_ZINOF|nr:hypothetical protein ZIOFF_051835 [Zingiber officinale]